LGYFIFGKWIFAKMENLVRKLTHFWKHSLTFVDADLPNPRIARASTPLSLVGAPSTIEVLDARIRRTLRNCMMKL